MTINFSFKQVVINSMYKILPYNILGVVELGISKVCILYLPTITYRNSFLHVPRFTVLSLPLYPTYHLFSDCWLSLLLLKFFFLPVIKVFLSSNYNPDITLILCSSLTQHFSIRNPLGYDLDLLLCLFFTVSLVISCIYTTWTITTSRRDF